MRCRECEYWDPPGPRALAERGYCRRFPPQLRQPERLTPTNAVHPATEPDDWCGEFKYDGYSS